MKINICLLILLVLLSSCTSSSVFKDIGDNIAAPSAMTIDATGSFLYMVNSNSNVLYENDQGSVQSYELGLNSAGIPVPVRLVSTDQTASLGGDLYLDATRSLIYVTNRYSENDDVIADHLLTVPVDQPTGVLSSSQSTDTALDPLGLACCYPADSRMWIATGDNLLQYVDLGGTLTPEDVDLRVALNTGDTISQAMVNFIAINSDQTLNYNQAFLSNINGGVFVVNLDDVGQEGKYPVDYLIGGLTQPRGLVSDGTYLYVLSNDLVDDTWLTYIAVISLESIRPFSDNTSTVYLDSDETSAIIVKRIPVASNPQKIVITRGLAPENFAFVSCRDSNNISVVNLSTQAWVKDIDVGKEPYSMAFYAPNGGAEQYLYVGNIYDNTISIIKVSSDTGQIANVATYP